MSGISPSPPLGIIADDNTGASDAAGMLTGHGIPTLLVLDEDAIGALDLEWGRFGAVVVGTRSRSVPPAAARASTERAAGFLAGLGVRQVQLKYCSTFDSTPAGNIGPSLDALADAFPEPAPVVVCPALPVNGRTVYQGHLFVHGQRLDESPLRDHPLNPMTDSNLVRWLQRQTTHKVGLVPWPTVRRGAVAVRDALAARARDGIRYAVADALADADLDALAGATATSRRFSGGSGITAGWARVCAPPRPPLDFTARLPARDGGALVVAGSQSPTTAEQNAHALANGFVGLALDVPAIIESRYDLAAAVRAAEQALGRGQPVLIYAPREDPASAANTRAAGGRHGPDPVAIGTRISAALATAARLLVERGAVNRVLVAGGETSGAVCRALDLTAVEVGLPIAPGVPWCFPVGGRPAAIVLKSGNFDGPTLYADFLELRAGTG